MPAAQPRRSRASPVWLAIPLAGALGAAAWLLLSSSRGGVGTEGADEARSAEAGTEPLETAVAGTLARDAAGVERARRPTGPDPAAAPVVTKAEGVYGRVLDGHEKPIGGARVLGYAYDPGAPWGSPEGPPLATTQAKEDGTYLVGPFAPGRLRIRAEAPGYAASMQYVSSRGACVDFLLDRGGSLRLKVRDAAGAAVPGADARVFSNTIGANATTNEAGDALLEGITTGQVSVRVTAKGRPTVQVNDVFVEAGKTTERTCVLGKGGAVSGRVLEEGTNAPVADVEVTVRPQQWGWDPSVPAPTAKTDAEGAFLLEGAGAPGDWIQVSGSKDGWVVTPGGARLPGGPGSPPEVVVKATKVDQARAIQGTVVDAESRPVPGALVVYTGMVRTQQGTVAPTATTDAAGSYTIALPPSTPKQWNYALAASAPGKGVGGVNVQSAKPVDVTIRLTGSGSVAGTVAGADGKPLEGAAVTITADSGSRMRGMPPPPPMSPDAASSVQALRDPRFSTLAASTDASGTFRVDGVPAGTYRVAAVWGLDRGEGSGQVTVRAGGTETVSLVVGGAGTIEGRVLETDGTPVTGATVWGSEVGARDGSRRSSSARSDETGAFKLRNVSGERWNLSVQAAGYTQKSVDNVSPGDRNLEVRLVALGWIEGVVLAEGKPWSGSFTVTAMFAGGNPNETVSSTRMVGGMGPMGGMYWAGNSQREESFSTPDGKFVMRALQAGPWRVNVTTPEGWIPTSPAEVTVADGRGAGPVEQRLVRGATVMGTVSEQGTVEPVSGASVSLRIKGQPETGGATNGWSQTDAKGRWSATGLAGGTYVLQAQCPSGFSVEEEIRLVAGDTLQRDLVALRLGSITVHAVDGEGKPVEGAAVTLTSESGTVVQPNWDLIRRQNLADFNKPDVWQKLQQTDVAGVLQRWHVPPGRVRVDVQLPRAGSQGSSLVDVASDRNTDVTVTLSGGSGPGGAPVPGK